MPFTAVTLLRYIVICYKPSGLPYRIGLLSADVSLQFELKMATFGLNTSS